MILPPINQGNLTNSPYHICYFLIPSVPTTMYDVLFIWLVSLMMHWNSWVLLLSVQIINSYPWKIGTKYITMDYNPQGKLIVNLINRTLSSDPLDLRWSTNWWCSSRLCCQMRKMSFKYRRHMNGWRRQVYTWSSSNLPIYVLDKLRATLVSMVHPLICR